MSAIDAPEGGVKLSGSCVVDQMPLHLSIAFFAVQVAAWTGLGLYLHMTHRRRAQPSPIAISEQAPQS